MTRSAAVFVVSVICLLAGACDPAPQATPSTSPALPGRERVDLRVVALLPTSRPTHLARSSDATIWWVQESEDGQDVAFALGGDGVPRATTLTSRRVLAAMQFPPPPAPRASGSLHSLAAGADGRVWFYFAGGASRRRASCVGTFDPRDDAIRIVLDDAQLRRTTAMGSSFVLARGTLAVAGGGDDVWLWLRHSDAAALFRIDAKTGAATRPLHALTTDAGTPLTMTRPGLALGAAPDGSLLLLDPDLVELWRVDPAAGRATSLHALVGLPTLLSAPAGDAKGCAFTVAANVPLIPARSEAEAAQILSVRYPALILIEPGQLRAIGRKDIVAPDGFALAEMRVQQLLAEPPRQGQAQSFLGYDEQSGALLRIKVTTAP